MDDWVWLWVWFRYKALISQRLCAPESTVKSSRDAKKKIDKFKAKTTLFLIIVVEKYLVQLICERHNYFHHVHRYNPMLIVATRQFYIYKVPFSQKKT